MCKRKKPNEHRPNINTHIIVVTQVTSVIINELRGFKLKHRGFEQSSMVVWKDTVKRWFITSGELGLSWHPCQVCVCDKELNLRICV